MSIAFKIVSKSIRKQVLTKKKNGERKDHMSPTNIPDEMWAVVLDSFSGPEALHLEKRPVPKPRKNEVLVKVAASAIHPADLELINGQYGYFEMSPPFVAGFVGSGTVVEVGGGLMGRYLKGKRVQCMNKALFQERGDGTWAEYMVTASDYAFPLSDTVDFEQGGAGSPTNALSALGLMDIATKGGYKAIVQTAAASTVGRMVYELCRREGIEVINVVRRDAQVEFLKNRGAALVLNSSDADFDQQLYEACHQHQVHLAFDAVGGTLTRQLLQTMPERSKVIIYGLLAGEPAQADMKRLVFQQKSIDNFYIVSWLDGKNLIQKLRLWGRAQKLVATGLKTEIRGRCPLQDSKQAVEGYQAQMTGGKLLLIPGE
jgi:NADPH2:quinone reductase